MFFSLDGIDGVGKSTQMALFCDWLSERGLDVVTCRDPGSTALGERVRDILLHSDASTPICPRAEMLLYMAARTQMVEEFIRPALAAGKAVVSDRFLLANLVYQAYAGGLPVEQVRAVGEIAIDGVRPDCTLLLDMPVEEADKRMQRDRDRMEDRGQAYRQKLRQGFLAEAARPESGICVIDALGTVDEVQQRMRDAAEPVL